MSKAVKKLFEMSESPFRVYESSDVDFETPKSSHQHVKRSFNSIENRDVKVKSWSRLFLTKYSHQLNTQTSTAISTKTPPTCKLDLNEPLAPIKPRRSINKSELKPKKLIFKDGEDYESDIIDLLSPMTLKSKQKIVVKSDDQSTNEEWIDERKQKQPSGRSRTLLPSDDKENCIENLWIKNKEISKQKQRKQSKERLGLKHLRI